VPASLHAWKSWSSYLAVALVTPAGTEPVVLVLLEDDSRLLPFLTFVVYVSIEHDCVHVGGSRYPEPLTLILHWSVPLEHVHGR
jgi:hypothetical protein